MITEKNFIQELQRRNEDALEFVVKNYGGLLKAVINRILYNFRRMLRNVFMMLYLKSGIILILTTKAINLKAGLLL